MDLSPSPSPTLDAAAAEAAEAARQRLRAANRFLAGIVALSLLSGITVGMNKVLSQLLGLYLSVEPWQLGIITGASSLAMALGTVPAGYLLSRGDPRTLYATVSLTLTVLFVSLPWLPGWEWVSIGMFAVGLCISLRIVAVSTAFMLRLPEIGQSRAGWYRGASTLGMQLLGPVVGNEFIALLGLHWGFAASGCMFALLAWIGWQVLPDGADNRARALPRPTADGSPGRPLPARLAQTWRIAQVRRIYLFEVVASLTAAAFVTFAILLAVEVLDWPVRHGVWLMTIKGFAYVTVLLGAGRLLLQSEATRHAFRIGHALVVAGLLLLGLVAHSLAYLGGSLAIGLGLGLIALINYSRISQADIDKPRAAAQMTLFSMLGGAAGSVFVGLLAQAFGLQTAFLLLTLPWLLLWPDPALLSRLFSPSTP